MGTCYLCQQDVPPYNDETLLISVIAAIYGTNHMPKGFSSQHIIIGDPQKSLEALQTQDNTIPHAHIYSVGNCHGSNRAREAVSKYPDAYEIIQRL